MNTSATAALPDTPYVVIDRQGHVAIVLERGRKNARWVPLHRCMRGMSIQHINMETMDRENKPLYKGDSLYHVGDAAERFIKAGKTHMGIHPTTESVLRSIVEEKGTTMSEVNAVTAVPSKTIPSAANTANPPKPVKKETAKKETAKKETAKKEAAKPAAKKAAAPKKEAAKPASKKAAAPKKEAAKPAAKKNGAAPRGRAPAIPGDAKITVLAKENPLREKSIAHKQFGQLKTGMTLDDAMKKGITRPYLMSWVKSGHLKVK